MSHANPLAQLVGSGPSPQQLLQSEIDLCMLVGMSAGARAPLGELLTLQHLYCASQIKCCGSWHGVLVLPYAWVPLGEG